MDVSTVETELCSFIATYAIDFYVRKERVPRMKDADNTDKVPTGAEMDENTTSLC
jgi:hypothetical protein